MKEQIKKILETEGLSPAKFADEIGIQRSSVSHILSGRNKPSYDLILKIINRFSGINAEWLLTGQGDMIKSSKSLQNISIKQKDIFDYPNNDLTAEEAINSKIENIRAASQKNLADTSKKTDFENSGSKSTKVTNVNNVKYILVFYENGEFEKFNSRS